MLCTRMELSPARLEALPQFEKVFEGDGRAVFRRRLDLWTDSGR